MCPGVEYGNACISAAALFELLNDEVHNCGLASPPASFEANGLAARLVADKVGDGLCESLMGATERVFGGRAHQRAVVSGNFLDGSKDAAQGPARKVAIAEPCWHVQWADSG